MPYSSEFRELIETESRRNGIDLGRLDSASIEELTAWHSAALNICAEVLAGPKWGKRSKRPLKVTVGFYLIKRITNAKNRRMRRR